MITGISVSKTGRGERLPASQITMSAEGRNIVFDTTLEEFKKNPRAAS